jgi:hypothetical protein
MKRGLRAWLALFSVATLLTVHGGLAHAAPQDITVTPTSASPTIAPGASYKGSLQVINNGQTTYPYEIYATPYHVVGEVYSPRFNALPNVTDPSKWFSFPITKLTSNPGNVKDIVYTINVPKDVPAGGYYATVFAQTISTKTQNSSVMLNERVGEVFYIQVAGPVTQKGQVIGWQVSHLQSSPLIATTRLQNSGGLHFAATVHVSVKDVFGRTKFSYTTAHEVLPQTTRRVNATWSSAPILGLYKVNGSVAFLHGHTTLRAQWVLVMAAPLQLALLGLAVLSILAAASRYSFNRGVRAKKKRDE